MEWRAVSYGTGKRHWYVVKGTRPDEVLSDKRGSYRHFGSMASAQRVADALNEVDE